MYQARLNAAVLAFLGCSSLVGFVIGQSAKATPTVGVPTAAGPKVRAGPDGAPGESPSGPQAASNAVASATTRGRIMDQ